MLKVALAAILTLMGGCAAREPSSTDNHHRIPQSTCSVMKSGGTIHRVCCDPDGWCVFAD